MLPRLGADVCVLKNRRYCSLALPWLQMIAAPASDFHHEAAACKRRWAQREKPVVQIEALDDEEKARASQQYCWRLLLNPCATSPEFWQEEEG